MLTRRQAREDKYEGENQNTREAEIEHRFGYVDLPMSLPRWKQILQRDKRIPKTKNTTHGNLYLAHTFSSATQHSCIQYPSLFSCSLRTNSTKHSHSNEATAQSPQKITSKLKRFQCSMNHCIENSTNERRLNHLCTQSQCKLFVPVDFYLPTHHSPKTRSYLFHKPINVCVLAYP